MTIRFSPWIPSTPGFEGVRLLLLGESHYEEPPEWVEDGRALPSDYTQDIVRNWGLRPRGRARFFANLYSTLTGEDWRPDEAALATLWEGVFFYNYVQALAPAATKCPTKEQWASASAPFREVLELIRPEAVLVLGERCWRNMVDAEKLITEEPEIGRVYGYRLQDGWLVAAGHIHHPSKPGFNPRDWHPKVASFSAWRRQALNGRE